MTLEPEEQEEEEPEVKPKKPKTPKSKAAAKKSAARKGPLSEGGRSVSKEYYNHASYDQMPVASSAVCSNVFTSFYFF